MSSASSLEAAPPNAEAAEQWARTALVLLGEATFREWLDWFCLIESDARDARGPIPFALHDYQIDRAIAWERGDSEVILKARQLGFSWLAAAYAYWMAAYHPSSHVAILSAGAREMRKFMRRVRFIWRRLPEPLRAGAVAAMESMVFANESMISGFPSTEDAGIGETNRVVILDEWAFHPYGEANLSALLPTIAAGGQLIGMSTADPSLGPSGHFYEQWGAATAGTSGFTPVFVPWNARPGRDAAWLERERGRHVGSEQAFRAFYPERPEDAFMGAEGLVYGADELQRLAWDAKLRVQEPPAAWRDCKWRIVAIDPGGRDPTAALPIGITQDERMHVYGEMYQRGPVGAIELSNYMSRIHGEGPIDLVLVDPSQASLVASLRSLGWEAYPANNEKLEGIALVRRHLLDGRLTVSPTAKGLINEFTSYWWPTRAHLQAGGKASDTVAGQGHHADALDALRYAVIGVIKGLPRHKGVIAQQWDSGVSERQNRPESFRERMERKRA